jgi:hypothetical protein
VKQEVNGTVILPPLVFPASGFAFATLHFFHNFGMGSISCSVCSWQAGPALRYATL